MGLFKKLFGRATSPAVATVADSVGNLAKDIRQAITGDIPAEQRGKLLDKYLDLTSKIVEMQANVVQTEMQGNQLQRSWRPILMYEIMAIIGVNYLFIPFMNWIGIKLTPFPFPDQLWVLLITGLNGYIASRGVEKVVTNLKKKG